MLIPALDECRDFSCPQTQKAPAPAKELAERKSAAWNASRLFTRNRIHHLAGHTAASGRGTAYRAKAGCGPWLRAPNPQTPATAGIARL